jgi:transcriptional regulator with XRE-family HTH domain
LVTKYASGDNWVYHEDKKFTLVSCRSNGFNVMLSDTLTEGLQKCAIGEKLRRLRLGKKMGLVEPGRHTGLSAAMLSKVERGRLFPTLPTLLRIAMVFNVGLEHFFSDGRHVVAVARKKDRLVFDEKLGGSEVVYRFECLDAIYFDSSVADGYRAAGNAPCSAVVVTLV